MNSNSDYKEISTPNKDILLTPKEYTSVLIWMHGLGDVAESYKDIFLGPNSPIPNTTKIYLLNAPIAPLSISNGATTTSWFDILSFGLKDKDSINYDDVIKNSLRVFKIIKNEAKVLGGYNKILVGGFSQGACMSFHIGYTFPEKIGGIISCSGTLFPQVEIQKSNEDLNVFVGHGNEDEVISCEIMKLGTQRIDGFKNVEKHIYPHMGHSICENELLDIKKFVERILK